MKCQLYCHEVLKIFEMKTDGSPYRNSKSDLACSLKTKVRFLAFTMINDTKNGG